MQYGLVRCEHNRPHWKTECICPPVLLFNARQPRVRSNSPLYMEKLWSITLHWSTCCLSLQEVKALIFTMHAGSDGWVRAGGIWVITTDLRVESLFRSFRFKRVIAVNHFSDSELVLWIIDMKDINQEHGRRKGLILFLLTEFKTALTSLRGMVNGKRLSYKRLLKKSIHYYIDWCIMLCYSHFKMNFSNINHHTVSW